MNFVIKQRGVSMVEVLIALLVLSVGSLGYLSMQTTMLTSTMDANQRSVASWAAQDLVERILSNPGAVATYAASADSADCTGAAPPSCVGRVCTTDAELAAFDLREVACSIDTAGGGQLLEYSLDVSCSDASGAGDNCGVNEYVTVTMTWASKSIADDKELAGIDIDSAEAKQTFSTTFRP